jgi:hypothetical protein
MKESSLTNKLLALLQTIVVGVLGWQLNATLEVRDRLTRLETVISIKYENKIPSSLPVSAITKRMRSE